MARRTKTDAINGMALTSRSDKARSKGADAAAESASPNASIREKRQVALHMTLPEARLDMVLGGPHPQLIELVRHLARAAAQDEQATWAATLNARQAPGGCESEEI